MSHRGLVVTGPVVLGLVAALVAPAEASEVQFLNFCTTRVFFQTVSTNGLNTCASMRVQTVAFGGGTQVQIFTRVLQGDPASADQNNLAASMFRLGLNTTINLTPGGATATVTAQGTVGGTASPYGTWNLYGGGGVIGLDYLSTSAAIPAGCDTYWSQPVIRTCAPQGQTGWHVLSFTTLESWDATTDLVTAFWDIDGRSTLNGDFYQQMTRCVTADLSCTGTLVTVPTVVPEPSTIFLVCTGLGAMGLVTLRRRQRATRERS